MNTAMSRTGTHHNHPTTSSTPVTSQGEAILDDVICVNSHHAFTVINSTQTHITTPTKHTNTAERQNRTLSRIETTLQSARMDLLAHAIPPKRRNHQKLLYTRRYHISYVFMYTT